MTNNLTRAETIDRAHLLYCEALHLICKMIALLDKDRDQRMRRITAAAYKRFERRHNTYMDV